MGYIRPFQQNSMKNRLLLLNWIAVYTRYSQRKVHKKCLHEVNLHCAALKTAALETGCVTADCLAEKREIAHHEMSRVNGENFEIIYGSILAKLKYIHSLERSRLKLLHRLGNKIAEVYPKLMDCKHIKSLFIGGALNCTVCPDVSQQTKLKGIYNVNQTANESEIQYLDWSDDSADGTNSTRKSSRGANHRISSDHRKDIDTEDTAAWDTLQHELYQLQQSDMLSELEEAVSFHFNVSGGFDIRASLKVCTAVDQKINDITTLLCRSGCAARQGASINGSLTTLQRLKLVHERYQKEVSKVLDKSIDHRFMQQRLPTRYAGTANVLDELRRKHNEVMSKAAATCEEACPFQFRFIVSSAKSASSCIEDMPPSKYRKDA